MSEAALLVQNVRRSMAGTYDVLGYVGTDSSGAGVLLARELTTGALVGISVPIDAANETQYSVQHTLGKTVTVPGSMCPECRTMLSGLDAFCFHCGANLSGSLAAEGTPDSAIVLQALETATAGRYEILGRIDREGHTAAVYFAREVASDLLAALRLTRVDAAVASHPDYVQKLTQIFETGELQAKIAQHRAQQAETVRAALERAEIERAATERAAAEHAAAERVATERVATERAATERAATERVAAEQQFVHADATAYAGDERPKKSGSMRTPLIGVGVVAVLALIGYFAFKDGSNAPTFATATTPADSARVPVATQPPTDSVTATTPATALAAPAPTASAAATPAADSGTIRVANVPAGARITVDGRSLRGRTLRVTARAHQLTITVKGFEPFTEKLTVASGATVRWSPKLVAIVAANIASNSTPAVAPANPNASGSKKSCRELMRAEDWTAAHDACTTEAHAGNAAAGASLGRLYAKGLSVARDPAAAITWYKQSAAGGDHDAQSFMGFALRDGNGVKRDEKASTEMFKLAAEGGEKLAQLEYAVALEKGDGVRKNQASARDWYKKAADQGMFMAARRLGRMFEKGDGGPKSEPDALAAYEKAATLGDGESAMTAGKWYRDGRGATPSPAQALTWFRKALELGNKDAQNEIKKLQK